MKLTNGKVCIIPVLTPSNSRGLKRKNVAMFGMTAKQWRESNPEQKGNIGVWLIGQPLNVGLDS